MSLEDAFNSDAITSLNKEYEWLLKHRSKDINDPA